MVRSKVLFKRWEIVVLKGLLWLYIILCLLIAGLNYGTAGHVDEQIAKLITKIWHFYENQFKTFLIIFGSILSLRIIGNKSKLQKRNFTGFILAALLIHIIGPVLTNNSDLYFFAMPFPWSTTALQLSIPTSDFYIRHYPLWGTFTISVSLIIYLLLTLVVYVGTLVGGRRWMCSHLCLFNGFISETFSPAFPLVSTSKRFKSCMRKTLMVLRWPLLAAGLYFVFIWLYFMITKQINVPFAAIMTKIESYKYLSLELLMAMFLWVVFTGRGYCHYCPLGTLLSFVSKLAGQRIKSVGGLCISCGKCEKACPMHIKIREKAAKGLDIRHIDCVGCGHCVDICPESCLEYSTGLLKRIRNR